MTEFTDIAKIDRLLAVTEEEAGQHGARLRKLFFPADRYLFDFNLDTSVWQQFDTENDASYFGIWVNKTALRTVSYVEGDVCFTQCADEESYDREIAEMCSFHGPGAAFSVIDTEAKTLTRHYQDRREFFIDPERAAQHLGKPEE